MSTPSEEKHPPTPEPPSPSRSKDDYALLWANGATFGEIYDMIQEDVTVEHVFVSPPKVVVVDFEHGEKADIVLGVPECTCGRTACESDFCDCDEVACPVDHAGGAA